MIFFCFGSIINALSGMNWYLPTSPPGKDIQQTRKSQTQAKKKCTIEMFYEVLSGVHSPDVLRIAIRNNKLHVYGGGWREKPLSWSVCLLLPHPQSFNTSIHSLHSQWISVMCRRRMFWTCEQFLTRRSLRSTLENTYEQERLNNNTGRVSNKAKQTRENSTWPNDLRR